MKRFLLLPFLLVGCAGQVGTVPGTPACVAGAAAVTCDRGAVFYGSDGTECPEHCEGWCLAVPLSGEPFKGECEVVP